MKIDFSKINFNGQSNEDAVALAYFVSKDYSIPDITYLSIGENNGRILSNTLVFAELGAAGVAVEPSPKAFAQLQENYEGLSNVTLLNVAVGNIDGTMPFYESGNHLGKGDVSLLSSLRIEETKRWKKETFDKIDVPVVTVPTLLTMCPMQRFDFISVDAEGEDYTIASQLDLHALKTKLIIVEWNSNINEFNKLNTLFVNQGFKLIDRNAENIMYGLH